ncbi:DNA double-strand break repair RAD50 ATPase [Perilla frutescens var. hirtella]|uniref:DNA double-strand break repair RAD50 ATPase n=1 Tax=Perilla frutescens var. hirtella TaxID=608512 RepID=A0AAD4PDW7_PERFH|nr:DNA double-strand break repair RAD50 ATPase [Perilla frutescens var. hirtella]
MADVISGNEISREDIQTAIAKAVELRTLHAALMQQGSYSPAASASASASNLRFPSASPLSRHDYPVFTPSYDDDPLPGYQQILIDSGNYGESWGEHSLDGGGNVEESVLSDYTSVNESSRKGVPFEGHICPAADDHEFSTVGDLLRSSAPPEHSKSRRNSMGDIRSLSSCNKCRPAIISSDSDSHNRKLGKKSNTIVPLTDSHSSLHSQQRSKGLGLTRLFPRLKKKSKNEGDELCQMLKDLGIVSVDTLKKEVVEANESRDAALSEAAEMKSTLGELKNKLEYLETYCEELKKALRQAVPTTTNSMPVSEEVMVEGFLQIVSEARLSVKQFCKTLVVQIEESSDEALVENLNSLLQQHKLSLNSKYSKAVAYHLEAIINKSLFQDFENCVFQKNGAPKHLDPQQDRQVRFESFVALRNLNWNQVLRKGTKCYSEELSKFCDEKMSGIIATLGCTRPWAEQLLQAFFVAAKCIWLMHLLAHSFNQPLGILRVQENMAFDSNYMEDIFGDRQRSSSSSSRVKIMVMPGFYVLDRVLRCKVLCRYKSAS